MSSPEQQTILITGASGFVATHIVDKFLRAGYFVRGTVRSNSTAEKVRQTFPHYKSQLSLTVVEDMVKPGAFDVAVQGIHGVIHTTTPFKIFVEDNERDLLRPAIDGTRNILDSLSKHAPQVNRHVYSKADWNPMPYEVAAAKDAHGVVAYSTAKALADRAAWDFVQEVKPQFYIATIMPPMIYGPNMNATANLASLNTSSADIYCLISPQSRSSDPVPENMFWSYVDVRDVAEAHFRAYEVPEAGGERFFVCNPNNFTYQQICDILRTNLPEAKDRVPAGNPGSGAVSSDLFTTHVSKSQKVLCLKYRRFEETIVDAARSLLALEANSS